MEISLSSRGVFRRGKSTPPPPPLEKLTITTTKKRSLKVNFEQISIHFPILRFQTLPPPP